MEINTVNRSIPPQLMLAAVMQQLAGDDSPEARDFRGWLQSDSFSGMGSPRLDEHRQLLLGLREIATRAPSGDDEALRQVLAASAGNEFAVEGAAMLPMFAAALEQASPLLRAFYNTRISKFDARDLVFSYSVFSAAFANGYTCASRIREALKARGVPVDEAEIAGYDKPAMLQWNGKTFSLKRGRSGAHCCWGIAAEDRELFIQAAGLVERRGEFLPFDAGDLVLSHLALGAAFANGDICARRIRETLKARGIPVEHADIAAYDKPAILACNGESFFLKKGKSGSACCWGIAAKDRERFIQAAKLVERQGEILPFDADDLVLSQFELSVAFANGHTCARKIHKALKAQGVPVDNAEIAGYDKPAMLEWNGKTFSLKKGWSGTQCRWGIAAMDRERFIQAAGLVERSPYALPRVGKNEVPLTAEGVGKVFRGTGEDGKELTGAQILERIKAAMHAE